MEYERGDKVKIPRFNAYGVVELYSSEDDCCLVELSGQWWPPDERRQWFNCNEVIPINKDVQEYHIDDRVRVVRAPKAWEGYVDELDKYVGLEGTVVGGSKYTNTAVYRLAFGVPGPRWNFPDWALAPAVTEEPKLNPGDLSGLFNIGGSNVSRG